MHHCLVHRRDQASICWETDEDVRGAFVELLNWWTQSTRLSSRSGFRPKSSFPGLSEEKMTVSFLTFLNPVLSYHVSPGHHSPPSALSQDQHVLKDYNLSETSFYLNVWKGYKKCVLLWWGSALHEWLFLKKFVFCFSLFCLKAFKTLIHYFLLSQNQYKLVLSQMDVIHQD